MISEEEAARLLGLDSSTMPAWTQGLILCDHDAGDDPIIFASKGFLLLTGYTQAEVIGRNCRLLQGPETDKRTVAAIRAAIGTGRRFDGELLNYRKDGSSFWNNLSIGPLASPERPGLFVGLQFDVSSRHRKD